MEHISPAFGVFLLMNNYFHDVSTAMLAASGIVLRVMTSSYRAALAGGGSEELSKYFSKVHGAMRKLAQLSLIWMLVGGIPRTLFYRDFEWANAVEHNQAIALILKHTMTFLLVALGAWLWKQTEADIKELK